MTSRAEPALSREAVQQILDHNEEVMTGRFPGGIPRQLSTLARALLEAWDREEKSADSVWAYLGAVAAAHDEWERTETESVGNVADMGRLMDEMKSAAMATRRALAENAVTPEQEGTQ